MKKNIHPVYKQTKITCVTCSNSFESGSTSDEIRIDTCNLCHPFFTGKDRSVKADGRVDRFTKKYSAKIILDKEAI
jgi:large subunit ribosomal protein L31